MAGALCGDGAEWVPLDGQGDVSELGDGRVVDARRKLLISKLGRAGVVCW